MFGRNLNTVRRISNGFEYETDAEKPTLPKKRVKQNKEKPPYPIPGKKRLSPKQIQKAKEYLKQVATLHAPIETKNTILTTRRKLTQNKIKQQILNKDIKRDMSKTL